MADADPPRLQFGTRAPAVRRAVGPTAWVVLEELVLASSDDGTGGRHIRASVRSLGRELGLAKDTIARALRRLTAAGLVRRDGQQHAGTGVFTSGSYVVDDLRWLLEVSDAGATEPRRRSGSSRDRAIQASLFEAGAST